MNVISLVNNSKVVEIVNGSMTKSEKIRRLFAITNDRSTVANLLNIRYQHVRNVLLQDVGNSKNVVVEMTKEHLGM